MRDHVDADRQLLQLAGDHRQAAIRRLRQRDHDLVDRALAAGCDQILEAALDVEAIGIEAVARPVVVDADELDARDFAS